MTHLGGFSGKEMGNRKSLVLCSRVIALSAKGMSGRRIAKELAIDKRTVARILASPEARRIAAAILHNAGMPADLVPGNPQAQQQKEPEANSSAGEPDIPPVSIRDAFRRTPAPERPRNETHN
jgi:hypothetical protein